MARTKTPNMGITLPDAGVDSRAVSDQLITEAFQVVDAHNHDSGKGESISSDRINFRSDMDCNRRNLNNVNSVNMREVISEQSRSLYVSGGDLYFKDSNGTSIKITHAGQVNTSAFTVEQGGPTTIFYGYNPALSLENAQGATVAEIKASALTEIPKPGTRTEITLNNLLLGGKLDIKQPAGHSANQQYHLWILIPTADSNNLEVYSVGYERETPFWFPVSGVTTDWTNTVPDPDVTYQGFVRSISYKGDDEISLILRNYRGAGGVRGNV